MQGSEVLAGSELGLGIGPDSGTIPSSHRVGVAHLPRRPGPFLCVAVLASPVTIGYKTRSRVGGQFPPIGTHVLTFSSGPSIWVSIIHSTIIGPLTRYSLPAGYGSPGIPRHTKKAGYNRRQNPSRSREGIVVMGSTLSVSYVETLTVSGCKPLGTA